MPNVECWLSLVAIAGKVASGFRSALVSTPCARAALPLHSTASRWHWIFLLMLAIAPLLASSVPAPAQTAQPELKIGTRVLPPMVVQKGGELTGFSIDLWNAISEKLNVKTTYQIAPDVRSLLELVRNGSVDAGIAAISITAAREVEFDFSQPMMSAGLQIMVRGKGKDAGDSNPLSDLATHIFSKAFLVWIGIALLMVIIPAHIVWMLERHHPSGLLKHSTYFPGIFDALYWASTTLATQGGDMPRHWLSRLITVLWMFIAIVFVAFYTAQLTANLTVQQIQGSINGPDDLHGKKVAATRGSTAVSLLGELRANVHEVANIDEAYKALDDKEVDAIVFDAPVLLYYAANEGKGKVHLIGQPFRREDYGIAFRNGGELRKRVNNVLLVLREDGTYQKLYDKWFTSK